MSATFHTSMFRVFLIALILMTLFFSCNEAPPKRQPVEFDKEKIDELLEKTVAARKIDPLSIINLADSVILLSQKLNYSFGELKGMYNKAIGYFFENRFDETFEWCDLTIDHLAAVSDIDSIQRHNIFGSTYSLKGVVYEKRGDYKLAIENLLKALKAFELAGDYGNIATAYNNLCNNFNLIEDYDKALFYLQKAEEIYLENNMYEKLPYIYVNKGNVYYNLGKQEEGLTAFEQGLDSAKAHNDFINIALALNNIGVYYEDRNKLELAIDYYLNANLINVERKDFGAQANTLGNISMVYLKAQDFYKALNYSNEALKISIDNNFPELIKFNYRNLARIYEMKGDFAESLEYFKKYDEVKDSLFDEQKYLTISNLEQKYNKERSERIIAQKDKELVQAQLHSRKLIASVIILSLIILFSVTIAIFLFKQAKFRKEKNTELTRKNTIISHQKEDLQILVNAYEIKREKEILIGKEKVFLDNIVYIKYQNRVTYIYLKDGSVIENRTQLSQLLSDLKYKSPFLFSQINQNYIVNFANVEINYFEDENEKYYYTSYLPIDTDEGRNEDYVKTRKRSGLNTNFEREYKRYLRMKQPLHVE